jgi:hypothetical protein
MADEKISDLDLVVNVNMGMEFPLNDFDTTKKSTLDQILAPKDISLKLCSSDSPSYCKYGVTEIIDTGDDAGAIINGYIIILNALGGGEIKLMEGTYNLTTSILPLSNVNIIGSGYGTHIKRNIITLAQLINIGNKNTFAINTSCIGIKFNNNPPDLTKNVKIINCWVNNNKSATTFTSAILLGTYIIGCICAENDAVSNTYGFDSCKIVENCIAINNIATNNGYGYYGCTRVHNCTGTGNKTALFQGSYFSSDNSVACVAGNGNA